MLARSLAYLRQGFSCVEAEFSGLWGAWVGCGAASVGGAVAVGAAFAGAVAVGAAFAGAVARGQMELAPFGWRAERRPGVLLVAAGQMELASFGSSLWVKRPSPGQAARPDAVAKTGADVTDRPRA